MPCILVLWFTALCGSLQPSVLTSLAAPAAVFISARAMSLLLEAVARDWGALTTYASLQKATVKGVTHVRVVVKGLGPGRWVSAGRSHSACELLRARCGERGKSSLVGFCGMA
jgi:hypothetical protein